MRSKKVPVKKGSELSRGGAITFLALMTSEEGFYMVGTHSTVEKRAKRMPDTTVETTLYIKLIK